MEKRKSKINKAFWISCRECSCEYLEPIEWVEEDGITECPKCHNKLTIGEVK